MTEPGFVPLREWGDLVPPSPGPSARMAWAQYGPLEGGNRRVTIAGVSVGATQLGVTVASGRGTVSANATFGSGGHFTADLTVPAGGPEIFQIEARDTSGALLDRASFSLAGPAAEFQPADLASLERSRSRFLAGTADRIVQRRAFSLLSVEQSLFSTSASLRFVEGTVMHKGKKRISVLDANKIGAKLNSALAPLLRRVHTGGLSRQQFDVEVSRQIRDAVRSTASHVEGKALDNLRKQIEKASKTPGRARMFMFGAGALGPGVGGGLPGESGIPGVEIGPDLNFYDWLGNHLKHIFDQYRYSSQIGVMFFERMRFRPAGLVAGEQLYSLSLTPGEEVQVRQVVETKRRETNEEIKTREDEQTLALSASWSTDVTEALDRTSSMQTAMNLGGNLGIGPTPEVPIGAGATMSSNMTDADSTTSQWSARTNQQKSAQATAKQRSEHKTRIEITNESSSSISTTRTIRNANRQRNATFVFSKLYRREHATLERYDARTCLRLVVDDPSRSFRGAFLAGLAKIDPGNPDLYEGALDGRITSTASGKMATPPFADGGFPLWPQVSKTYWTFSVDLPSGTRLADGSTVPSGYVLGAVPTFKLNSFRVYDSGKKYVANAPLTSESMSTFCALGGSLRWDSTKTPKVMQGVTSGVLTAATDHIFYADGFATHSQGISDIDVTVTASWVPSAALEAEIQAKHDATRALLIQALRDGALLDLRSSVDMNYEGCVVAQAVRDYLASGDSIDLSALRQTFEFEEAIVEGVPYWATPGGQMHYQELRGRLEELPIPVSVDALLTRTFTDSQAIVYLPVKEGFEDVALRALGRISDSEIGRVRGEIEAYRAGHYPPAGQPLSGYQSVSGPVPPLGTPAGATTWQNGWEAPAKAFDVLAEWQELVPTDGVHIETLLSDSVVTDENARLELQHQLGA